MNCQYRANIKVRKSSKRVFFNLYTHFKDKKQSKKELILLYCILAVTLYFLREKKNYLTSIKNKEQEDKPVPYSFLDKNLYQLQTKTLLDRCDLLRSFGLKCIIFRSILHYILNFNIELNFRLSSRRTYADLRFIITEPL